MSLLNMLSLLSTTCLLRSVSLFPGSLVRLFLLVFPVLQVLLSHLVLLVCMVPPFTCLLLVLLLTSGSPAYFWVFWFLHLSVHLVLLFLDILVLLDFPSFSGPLQVLRDLVHGFYSVFIDFLVINLYCFFFRSFHSSLLFYFSSPGSISTCSRARYRTLGKLWCFLIGVLRYIRERNLAG